MCLKQSHLKIGLRGSVFLTPRGVSSQSFEVSDGETSFPKGLPQSLSIHLNAQTGLPV